MENRLIDAQWTDSGEDHREKEGCRYERYRVKFERRKEQVWDDAGL